MKLAYLVDCDQHIDTVSKWLYKQWGFHYSDKTRQDYLKEVQDRLNRQTIPTTFIALQDREPIGTASLIKHDMDTHKHLTPWLADVYVKPEFRNKGIGSRLVRRVMKEAKDININRLYLFTREAKDFYLTMSWRVKKTTEYHGDQVDLMFFDFNKKIDC